jgi:hypothetical protein
MLDKGISLYGDHVIVEIQTFFQVAVADLYCLALEA